MVLKAMTVIIFAKKSDKQGFEPVTPVLKSCTLPTWKSASPCWQQAIYGNDISIFQHRRNEASKVHTR